MANDPDAKIACPTPHHLQAELDALADALALGEKEETWEKIEKALIRFAGVTRGGGYKHLPLFTDGVGRKGVGPQVAATILSDRGRFSASAIDLLQTLAPRLGLSFQPIVQVYLEALVKLLARPNKVFFKRAEKCLSTIILHCHLPSIVIELKRGLSDDAVGCRRGCAAGIERAMREWDTGIWGEKGLVMLEEVLRKIAVDRDQEVRATGKRVWKLFCEVWPERVEEFSAPLTPTARRYLDIASTTAPNKGKGKAPAKAMAPASRPISVVSLGSSSSSAPQPLTTKLAHQRTQSTVSRINVHPVAVEEDPIPRRISPTKPPQIPSSTHASPKRYDDPPIPALHRSKSVAGFAMHALKPVNIGRSTTQASLHNASQPSQPLPSRNGTSAPSSPSTDPFQSRPNPLTAPTRPTIPISMSTLSLHSDPFETYSSSHRRLPPAVRVASTSIIPQTSNESTLPPLLRGAQRGTSEIVESWMGIHLPPKKMGQAQRRVVTAPNVTQTPGWSKTPAAQRSVKARVKQLEAVVAQGPASPTPREGEGRRGEVDSPLLPVLRVKARGREEEEDLRRVEQIEGGDVSMGDGVVREVGSVGGEVREDVVEDVKPAEKTAETPAEMIITEGKGAEIKEAGILSAEALEKPNQEGESEVTDQPGQGDELVPSNPVVNAFPNPGVQPKDEEGALPKAEFVLDVPSAGEGSTTAMKEVESDPVAIPLPDTPIRASGTAHTSDLDAQAAQDEMPSQPAEAQTMTDVPTAIQDRTKNASAPSSNITKTGPTAKPPVAPPKVPLPPVRKPVITARIVSGGSTAERKPFKPTSQAAKTSTASSGVVKAAPPPKPAVPTARVALAASKAAVTKAALVTSTSKTNATVPAKPKAPTASAMPAPPPPASLPRKPEVPKATAAPKPRVVSNPTSKPIPFPKATPTLPAVPATRIKRKPPIPQFIPVPSSKRAAAILATSTSSSSKGPIKARVKPENIALPASPEKPDLPPTEIPLPPTPPPNSESFPRSPRHIPSPLRQSTLPLPTPPKVVSPTLTTSPASARDWKLVDLPTPSSYPSTRLSVSARFESQPSTRAAMTERAEIEEEEEEDVMEGVSFGVGGSGRRVKVKIREEEGRDLMEFSNPSRAKGEEGVKGEGGLRVGTPGGVEEVLKGFMGTPGERRRVLSMRDVNEGM